ncbi:F-box domain containing protein [Tanacetum coccineum]
MDHRRDIKRANVEVDRLSSLPDDLIHKILYFIGLRRAIGTSVLSSRWRYIWTSIPCLDFSSFLFSTLPKFSTYVTNVLSRRNNLEQVFSIKFCFSGDVKQEFVKQIMKYAFSHNIQQLNITCLLMNSVRFPLSLFKSQSLKHLSLTCTIIDDSPESYYRPYALTASPTLELPALTTLYLGNVTMRGNKVNKSVGIFSKCPNLKNLTMDEVKTKGLNVLNICHPLLSDLTVKKIEGRLNCVNVIAPQLKNLSICSWTRLQFKISAPDLSSLSYNGYHPLCLFTEGFGSLEKVYLGVYGGLVADAPRMFRLLHHLQSVKFLTLSLESVEVLSSSLELFSDQTSPFTNLKMLKIYPEVVHELAQKNVSMSVEVKKFLLNGSPSATFTMVSRQEIIAKRNTGLVQKRMENLRVKLEREKAVIETNMAHIDQRNTPMEIDKAKVHEQHVPQLDHLVQSEKTMTHIDACFEDLSKQIEKGKSKISNVISDLDYIKQDIAELPTLNRAELEPCYSSLCSEADIAVKKIMDHVKILCDMKESRFSVYNRGLATTSLPSV